MQSSLYLCLFVVSSIARSKAYKSWEMVSSAPGYCSITDVEMTGKSKQGGKDARDAIYEGLTPREAVPIRPFIPRPVTLPAVFLIIFPRPYLWMRQGGRRGYQRG